MNCWHEKILGARSAIICVCVLFIKDGARLLGLSIDLLTSGRRPRYSSASIYIQEKRRLIASWHQPKAYESSERERKRARGSIVYREFDGQLLLSGRRRIQEEDGKKQKREIRNCWGPQTFPWHRGRRRRRSERFFSSSFSLFVYCFDSTRKRVTWLVVGGFSAVAIARVSVCPYLYTASSSSQQHTHSKCSSSSSFLPYPSTLLYTSQV